MKKAVIKAGGNQYVVSENDTLDIALVKDAGKTLEFEPLLVIDGEKVTVGTPAVSGVKVKAKVVAADIKADKVTAVRYKAKKRVKKVHGHRQRHTQIQISSIA